MRTRTIGTLATVTLALLLPACGGGGGAQDDVADMMLEAAEDEGLQLDEECVRDAAGRLSDEDAQTILDAGPDGDPELSAGAEEVANSLFGCFDTDAFVDQLVAQMGGAAEGLDVECLKEAFRNLDPATFEDDPAFATAMTSCLELGG